MDTNDFRFPKDDGRIGRRVAELATRFAVLLVAVDPTKRGALHMRLVALLSSIPRMDQKIQNVVDAEVYQLAKEFALILANQPSDMHIALVLRLGFLVGISLKEIEEEAIRASARYDRYLDDLMGSEGCPNHPE